MSISRLPPGRPRIALHRVRLVPRIVAAADVAAAADHRHADARAGAQQDHLAADVGGDKLVGHVGFSRIGIGRAWRIGTALRAVTLPDYSSCTRPQRRPDTRANSA